ncbi:MAG: 50S ribosomal protein L10 [Candidatus Omnitrophica bacterium]|nr:50S ribosomal protein L10 [Candidatus Omnitrophota bacterium]
MKKIGLVFKEASEKRIKDSLKGSNAVFIVKYSGVKSPDMSSLRQSLKPAGARLFVVKNSVARRAFKSANIEILIKNVEGNCGLIFAKDEPVAPSKVLCNFTKDHEALKLEGGYIGDKIIERKDIESMAKLPSKEILRAQVVMALNSPISGLVITLNQVLAKFVICLDQIRVKKTSN